MAKSRLTSLPNADPRISAVDMTAFHIEAYDVDNGYPQRINNLLNASSTAKAAVTLYAKFIRGGGFVDPDFYRAFVNDSGLTADTLLRRLSSDYAEYRGVAIHMVYNQLFQLVGVNYIPFENARKSKSDEEKYNNKIALYDNWYNFHDVKKKTLKLEDIDFLDRYNPDPEVIAEQVAMAVGWNNWKGQVLYYSADYEAYPLASCDSIVKEMQAEIASSTTTYINLRNNFSDKTVFSIGTVFETEAERQEYVNSIRTFVGPEGETIMLAEGSFNDKGEVAAPVIEKISNTLNDKIFEYSDSKVSRKIIRNYNQPGILHTDTDTSALGKDDIVNATDFYNGVTADERILFTSMFETIFADFHENINPSGDYNILPFSYMQTVEEGEDVRLLIEIIGVGGVQALQAILADTTLTPAQKKSALTIVFGLNEEQAADLAGVVKTEE